MPTWCCSIPAVMKYIHIHVRMLPLIVSIGTVWFSWLMNQTIMDHGQPSAEHNMAFLSCHFRRIPNEILNFYSIVHKIPIIILDSFDFTRNAWQTCRFVNIVVNFTWSTVEPTVYRAWILVTHKYKMKIYFDNINCSLIHFHIVFVWNYDRMLVETLKPHSSLRNRLLIYSMF